MADPYLLVVKGSEWLTSNKRRNRYEANRIAQEWRQNTKGAAWQSICAGVLPKLERVHIYAYVTFRDRRNHDAGNWYPTAKPCVDGLVDAGVLIDDNDSYVIGPDMRPDRRATSPIPTLTLHIHDLAPTTQDLLDRIAVAHGHVLGDHVRVTGGQWQPVQTLDTDGAEGRL